MLKGSTADIIKEFRKHEKDIGSCEVQIALLSKRIAEITEHLKKYRKDFATQRSLMKLVGQRKAFLKYLIANDYESYKIVVKKLNLRN